MTQQSARTPYTSGMLSNDAGRERDRLTSIQGSADTFTTGVLDRLPVEASWNCLELGAGAGSIAYWLTGRCPDGRVVGVDLDTRHLDAGRAANLEIQEADITDEDYAPGSFDLIHARYLFCHLATRDDMVARVSRWLSPVAGSSSKSPTSCPVPPPLPRDAAHPRRLPAHVPRARRRPHLGPGPARPPEAGSGLSDVAFAANPGYMGGLDKDRWLPLISQAAPTLLADGLVTEADLAEFHTLLKDPAFIDIPQMTLSAWARRPA